MNDLCVDTLDQIFSFTEELRREDGEEEIEEKDEYEEGGESDDAEEDEGDSEDGEDKDDDAEDVDEDKDADAGDNGKTANMPSTPSSKTSEENEENDGSESEGVDTETADKSREEDVEDGTSRGVECEAANKPSYEENDLNLHFFSFSISITPPSKTNKIFEDQEHYVYLDDQNVMDATQTAEQSFDEATIIAVQAISQLSPEGMLPVKENVLLLTQGEDPGTTPYTTKEEMDVILQNLSETVFVKLEKSCYKTAPPEVKEKMATMIRNDCPRFSLLSQHDPKEESSLLMVDF
ncbi:nuclear polyadenylated RNA-binding protein 3-like [Papaver somniferum]|uniref:nuclear polyadenylated RNA-binding protein 3-like n=1 Tax=Papaver somniferum TaxID=3469 RepID=UPI000E6F901D|nr:nuclear polyadenylated RNA-binding protein 3-like [Papaver somniferum]